MRSREERQKARAANNALFRQRCETADDQYKDKVAKAQTKVTQKEQQLEERIRAERLKTWTDYAERAEALVLEAAAEPNARRSKQLAKRAERWAKAARKVHAKLEADLVA